MSVSLPRQWILGSRDFSFLLSTRFLVVFATQIQAVAVGWLLYSIKQDPLYLGLIGLAEVMPALTFALVSGWIVDRSRPLFVYRMAILCSALSAGLLVFISGDASFVSLGMKVFGIFFAAFLTGFARSFISPAQFSILPLTVPREFLGKATAWSSSLVQVSSLAGPAFGGFLYAFAGARGVFGFVLTILLLAQFTARELQQGREKRKVQTNSSPGFFSGVQFVFAHQIILAAMSLDMFAVLFGGATALFPIFARDIFSNGPVGLGFLRASMPFGSFLMGWFLIRFPISRFSGKSLLIAFCGFGLSIFGFGLSHSFILSCALLVLTGMCDSVSMVTRQTILQMSTPPEMRGRVASVSSIFIGSSNEIGAFESGLAAKVLGLRPSILFGASMTILVVVITWFRAPKLRKLKMSDL